MPILGYLITDPKGERYLAEDEDQGLFGFELYEIFFIEDFAESRVYHIEDAVDNMSLYPPNLSESDPKAREATEVYLENVRGAVSAALLDSSLTQKHWEGYAKLAAFLNTAVVKEVYLGLR